MDNKTEVFFNKYSKEYEKKSKLDYFNKNISWVLEELNNIKFESLLDVGCGTGEFLGRLEHKNNNLKLVGIDISSEMVKKSKNRVKNSEIFKGDVHDLPFSSSSFDVIVSTASFHHYEDRLKALLEMKRVLKPGGILFILDSIKSVSNLSLLPYYWDYVDSKHCYSVHLKENEFIEDLEKSGYRDIKVSRKYRLSPVVYALIEAKKEPTNELNND